MEPHQELGRISPEPLEQELYARNLAIERSLDDGDSAEAERLAWELVHESQPREYRSDGFHVLGMLAAERGLTVDALEMLEEARRLAIDTCSYAHAAEIQRTLGFILRDHDPEAAREAFSLRREYQEEARRLPPERFQTLDADY